jgi:hypothetical protein
VRHLEQKKPGPRESQPQNASSDSSPGKRLGCRLQEKAGATPSSALSGVETSYNNHSPLAKQDPLGPAHSSDLSSHSRLVGATTCDIQTTRRIAPPHGQPDGAPPCDSTPAGIMGTGTRNQHGRQSSAANFEQEALVSASRGQPQSGVPPGMRHQEKQEWYISSTNAPTSYVLQQEHAMSATDHPISGHVDARYMAPGYGEHLSPSANPAYAAYQREILKTLYPQAPHGEPLPMSSTGPQTYNSVIQAENFQQHSQRFQPPYGAVPASSTDFIEDFPVGFVGSYAMDEDPPMIPRNQRFREQQQMMTDLILELHK